MELNCVQQRMRTTLWPQSDGLVECVLSGSWAHCSGIMLMKAMMTGTPGSLSVQWIIMAVCTAAHNTAPFI